ncbi:hypothetical protein TPB0596_08710 [Tsukamurella pulmonis]|uniref:DUF4333 domain-containing protein n=1 Tax=Tsukamurella pulmonis TaxID=47312 RepID=UPI001EE09D0F|nr:DUF4333 domain-containing protein [Tsukamurella pulmonis]BDD81108.1 hypothetical protein TPB0596_08710 [Tsukamurella pulmonis]
MGLRAVAVVVGGAGVAVALCWSMISPPEIDQEQVESGTLARVAAAPTDHLHCDGGLKAEVGAAQSCVLDRGDEEFAVHLTVTDVDGDRVNWDSTVAGVPRSGQRVTVAELEQRTREVLARDRRVDTVTCAGGLPGTVGARQSCAMTARGHRHDVVVTVTTVDPARVQWGVTVDD